MTTRARVNAAAASAYGRFSPLRSRKCFAGCSRTA